MANGDSPETIRLLKEIRDAIRTGYEKGPTGAGTPAAPAAPAEPQDWGQIVKDSHKAAETARAMARSLEEQNKSQKEINEQKFIAWEQDKKNLEALKELKEVSDEAFDRETERHAATEEALKEHIALKKAAAKQEAEAKEEADEREKTRQEATEQAQARIDARVRRTVDATTEFGSSLAANLKITEKTVASSKNLGKSMEGLYRVGKKMFEEPQSWLEFNTMMVNLGSEYIYTMVDNMLNLAAALYETEQAFQRATGASLETAQGITEVYVATRDLGVELKDVAATYETLYDSVTEFANITQAEQEQLTRVTVTLGKLGVEASAAATGIQVATKALGQSEFEASQTQLELAALAIDIGKTPKAMASEFAAAAPQLAKFGNQGVDAFKRLSIASKITGMDIGKILSLVEKFDTFEGAAKQAGMLNAALGGNFVNAMELMMETDPIGRFEMIRDSILDAGLSFDDMSYYQKKFYTEAAGLSEVNDLALLLSGNMESLTGNIGMTSAEIEAMEERAQSMMTLQEAWNALVAEMTPALTGAITHLRTLTAWIIENKEEIVLASKGLFVFVTVMLAGFALVSSGALAMAAGIAAITGAFGALIYLLFDMDVGASKFWEGLGEIAGGFESITAAASLIPNVFKGVAGATIGVTHEMFGREVGASKFVDGLGEHGVAGGFEQMAVSAQAAQISLQGVDTVAAQKVTGLAQATVQAQTAVTAAQIAATTTPAGVAAPSAAALMQKLIINVGGTTFEKEVKTILGKEIRDQTLNV